VPLHHSCLLTSLCPHRTEARSTQQARSTQLLPTPTSPPSAGRPRSISGVTKRGGRSRPTSAARGGSDPRRKRSSRNPSAQKAWTGRPSTQRRSERLRCDAARHPQTNLTSKADPRIQQDWFLKCLQGGRALHLLAACGVHALLLSTEFAWNESPSLTHACTQETAADLVARCLALPPSPPLATAPLTSPRYLSSTLSSHTTSAPPSLSTLPIHDLPSPSPRYLHATYLASTLPAKPTEESIVTTAKTPAEFPKRLSSAGHARSRSQVSTHHPLSLSNTGSSLSRSVAHTENTARRIWRRPQALAWVARSVSRRSLKRLAVSRTLLLSRQVDRCDPTRSLRANPAHRPALPALTLTPPTTRIGEPLHPPHPSPRALPSQPPRHSTPQPPASPSSIQVLTAAAILSRPISSSGFETRRTI
jgi:hypothetical protein